MNQLLKLIFAVICILPCFWAVSKSDKPNVKRYEEYIQKCEACANTQTKLSSALKVYCQKHSTVGNVKDSDKFERVESLLIDSGCLENNYRKPDSTCCYAIVDEKVICIRHAGINEIENNIASAKRAIEKDASTKKYDYLLVLVGTLIFLVGLFT